jgi:hypothetical protein
VVAYFGADGRCRWNKFAGCEKLFSAGRRLSCVGQDKIISVHLEPVVGVRRVYGFFPRLGKGKTMKRQVVAMMTFLLTWLATMTSFAEEIPFAEQFALAEDREAVLRQLIPGTEDYYYYHSLHYQHLQQFDQVEPLLQAWLERFQATPRWREIRNRQALLTYELNADASLAHLRHEMQLQFNHQRRTRDEVVPLPSHLDASLITREAFLQRALEGVPHLQQVEDSGLILLLQHELTQQQRRELLSRVTRPDLPELLPLILLDLEEGVGFGSYPIHEQLLLSQLDELRSHLPNLNNSQEFVGTYLARLLPGPDEDLETDRDVRQAYFVRLREFVDRLPASFNSLKAQVLYHQLSHDRQRGVHDRDLLQRYLALPRSVPYMRPAYLQRRTRQEPMADLRSTFSSDLPFGPIGNDEPLVRAYLAHFFEDATSFDDFGEWIREEYLREVFAETKLVLGLGDAERYLSWLSPDVVQRLRDRVDLEFAPTNRQQFAQGDPIRLELFIKNVPTLIVKVYEINSANFYRENQREIDTSINLDGLTPNWEETHRYEASPLRRVRREFEFLELSDRGVYVIDFIGSGQSSRVLVRRGGLRHLSETTTRGQLVKVLDQDNQHLPNATLELNGRVFTANQRGEILVPFSTDPGEKMVILGDEGFHSLERFMHVGEEYRLRAGIYVDRESLLDSRQATVMVRASLQAGRLPISLSVLEDVRMRVVATDHDGVPTSFEVEDFKLYEDRETSFPVQVPSRLSQIAFQLTAKITPRTKSEDVQLEVTESFAVNALDTTQAIDSLQLIRTPDGYQVEVLGRTGESQADRLVRLQLRHRGFLNYFHTTLKTDERGRISLGAIEGIETVQATLAQGGGSRSWRLKSTEQSFLASAHGVAGQSLDIPYPGLTDDHLSRELFSLLELRGDQFSRDHFDSLRAEEGALRLHELPPGEYDLRLHAFDRSIRVRIVAGANWQGHVLGEQRILEARSPRPARISRVETRDPEVVRVRLAQADPFTRVHVIATRYVPELDVYAQLAAVRDAELQFRRYPAVQSAYVEGRNIGDEYRYIIERKYQTKFPGNMLARPTLLLNPWAVHDTVTTEQLAAEGEEFAARGAPPASPMGAEAMQERRLAEASAAGSLDFLAKTSTVLLNLRADSRGTVEIEKSALGDRHHLHLVLVHPRATSYLQVVLDEKEVEILDRRLPESLDLEKHFIHKKQVQLVETDEAFTLQDVASSRFEIYDSRAKVFALYATLVEGDELPKFSWLTKWHGMEDQQKRALYSQHACHELHFFLKLRDEEFFEQVVTPYLQQKREKQFLDHWLLGNDLRDYQQPARYARLNVLEQILLAERMGERSMVAREMEHELDIRVPDIDQEVWLFEAALSGIALEGSLPQLEAMSRQLMSRSEYGAGNMMGMGGMGMGGMAGGGMDRMRGRPSEAMSEEFFDDDSADPRSSRVPSQARRMGRRDAGQSFFGDFDDAEMAEMDSLARELYRPVDQTREWAETHYYRQRMENDAGVSFDLGPFWRDYARHDPDKPFVSVHFAEPTAGVNEALLALTLLDLPAEAAEHEIEFEQGRLTLKPGSPLLVLFEELHAVEEVGEEGEILVNQHVFRPADRQRRGAEDPSQEDGPGDRNECLVQEVYGCQVVVTNTSSRPQRLDVLLQIPQGAIPLAKGRPTRTQSIKLDPFQTHRLDYYFYFPKPGTFTHYPVQVSRDGKVVAFAAPRELKGVTRLSQENRQSWEYVSQRGTEEEVLRFLRDGNLQAVSLSDLAWRMRDLEFYRQVVEHLQARRLYDHTLWSYSVLHNDRKTLTPYLEMSSDFLKACGPYLQSPLVTIDPEVRRVFEHLEYRPLVNQRAHPLGGTRRILNNRFAEQYRRLMNILSCRPSLDDRDRMSVVYYLLLQDRIEEAQEMFTEIDPNRLDTRLQYDYCAAYLDFFQPDPSRARSIVARYADHPVESWRKLFAAVSAKLDELDGGETVAVDERDRDQRQTSLAASGESVELSVESGELTIGHQNVETLTINFYEMDIELLFSRNPFVQGESGQFSWIRPHWTERVTVQEGVTETKLPLPENLRNRNILVEVKGRQVRRWQPYYANSLRVQLHADYGQVRVVDRAEGHPLPKVYVKVYARLRDGRVVFHKDGYTDLRGRFDYSSVSTNQLDQVQRFALLIFSDDQGAEVRETAPPAR